MKKEKVKLENFTKSELIQAIRYLDKYYSIEFGGNVEKKITRVLEDLSFDNARHNAEKAFKKSNEAMDKYFEWQKEIVEKYGDGKKVSLSLIPQEELKKGAELEDAWLKAEKERKSASAREDKLFNLIYNTEVE